MSRIEAMLWHCRQRIIQSPDFPFGLWLIRLLRLKLNEKTRVPSHRPRLWFSGRTQLWIGLMLTDDNHFVPAQDRQRIRTTQLIQIPIVSWWREISWRTSRVYWFLSERYSWSSCFKFRSGFRWRRNDQNQATISNNWLQHRGQKIKSQVQSLYLPRNRSPVHRTWTFSASSLRRAPLPLPTTTRLPTILAASTRTNQRQSKREGYGSVRANSEYCQRVSSRPLETPKPWCGWELDSAITKSNRWSLLARLRSTIFSTRTYILKSQNSRRILLL